MAVKRDVEGAGVDRARENPPSLRKALTGLAIDTGAAKGLGEAALMAGYAPTTVRNLTRNGITLPAVRRARAEVFPEVPTLASLSPASLQAIADFLNDPNSDPRDKAALGLQIEKERRERGEDDVTREPRSPWENGEDAAEALALLRYGARLAARLGPEKAIALLEARMDRLPPPGYPHNDRRSRWEILEPIRGGLRFGCDVGPSEPDRDPPRYGCVRWLNTSYLIGDRLQFQRHGCPEVHTPAGRLARLVRDGRYTFEKDDLASRHNAVRQGL